MPETDNSLLITREQMEDEIAAIMGGRAAEQVVFGKITGGAASDLQQATNRARSMIMQLGMSPELGQRTFGDGNGNPFLGRGWMDDRDYSEEAARIIDEEIKRITNTAYERAETILSNNRDKLEMLAQVLMERETLDREEFEYLMEHGELPGDIADVFDTPDAPEEPAPSEPEQHDAPTDGADAGETGSNLGPAPA